MSDTRTHNEQLDRLTERAAIASLFAEPAQALTTTASAGKQPRNPAQTLVIARESTPSTFPPENGAAHVSIAFRAPDPAASRAGEGAGAALEPVRLTRLELAFVDALLRSPTLDRAGAYLVAAKVTGARIGGDPSSAGRALYGRPKVQAELARRRKAIEQAQDAQVVQLETAIARQAFADLRTLFDDHGNVLPPHMWPDDVAAAVQGIEIEEETVTHEDTETVTTKRKLKLVDRLASQKVLMARRGIAPASGSVGPGFVAHFDIRIGGEA